MKAKYQKLEEQVKQILTAEPFARDSDEALFAQILKLNGVDTQTLTAAKLLQGMFLRSYPNWESVSRYRRMCQKKYPELRGTKYEERHDEQLNVKEDLGYEYTPLGAPGTTP